jgi:DNA-directed RNA polymerase specialized sigma24 family protein
VTRSSIREALLIAQRENLTASEAAQRTGENRNSVAEAAKRLGVVLRKGRRDADDRDVMVKMFLDGLDYVQIAKLFGMSRENARIVLCRLGFKVKDRGRNTFEFWREHLAKKGVK